MPPPRYYNEMYTEGREVRSHYRAFADWLFDTTGVFVTPGTNFGAAGEGYVRISITAADERIESALQRMKAAVGG